MKKKLLLGLLLVLALFFRLYGARSSFKFAHDHDLYSWIAKDIVVDKHFVRLVGQQTSVDGVFIGPAYYYLMAVFYWIFSMNPFSAIIPVSIIGVAGVFSFYYLIDRFWGKKSAWVGAVIYATSFGVAEFERWSVPTQPTMLWSIWFLIVILDMLKGRLKFLPLYGLLVGLVYHIHIALLPILPLPILAYFLAKKREKIKLKQVLVSMGLFLIIISPFLVFELKHNLMQSKAALSGINDGWGGPTGIMKIKKVLDASGKEFSYRLVYGWGGSKLALWIWVFFGVACLYLMVKKKIEKKQFLLMFVWIGLIMWFQFKSEKRVSEYYFSNLVPIYLLMTSLFVSSILKKKIVLIFVLLLFVSINSVWLVKNSDDDNSLKYKVELVEAISNDVKSNNYACVAINYISDPGWNVGFRYLFWLNDIKVISSNSATPIYDIVIPSEKVSDKDLDARFGRFGLILAKTKDQELDPAVCENENYQLDPLLGYTD